jgi:glycosyltransferase involved in cell wall biosynthesis
MIYTLLKFLSDQLQRFPLIWSFGVRVHGIRLFIPSKVKYRKRSTHFASGVSLDRSYELIFDAQCLQTQTRQRGIGSYSLKLINAICQERADVMFAAVLTTTSSSIDLEIAKTELGNLNCSNLDILILDPFKRKSKLSLKEAQQELRHSLESFGCRAVVCLSAFEKQDMVITPPRSSKYKRFAVLYDLIPLQFPADLLISRHQKSAYAWSLDNLTKCDRLFSISHESKRHWKNMIPSNVSITVIHGGIDSKQETSNQSFNERSGVLCIAAEQPHKNIDRLISAYCQLPEAVQLQNELIIVGIRSSGVRKKLNHLSRSAKGNVRVPLYLNAADLKAHYESSRLLIMPSLIEGLSLPILEAWSYGLVTIGSSGTVAKELIFSDALLFDPNDILSITQCMNRLLTSEKIWNSGLDYLVSRSALFSWSNTAELMLNAIEVDLN